MTGRERLTRIFNNQETDRPSFKLWGLGLGQKIINERYRPVYERAAELTDIWAGAGSKIDPKFGSKNDDIKMTVEDIPRSDGDWIDRHTALTVSGRTLTSVFRWSRKGNPGYDTEHLIKEPDDLRAVLAHEYIPYPVDISSYHKADALVGERGIATFGLPHAAYEVQRIMGSEAFALFCMDERELIAEAVAVFKKRIYSHVRAVLEAGIKPVFSWVGPELCIPPLAGMNEFEEFVFAPDKEICDLIHSGGGNVWVHCHGRVGRLIERFIGMGVDVLNPIEPPPQGDVTMNEAVAAAKGRIGLEGNIEIGALLLEKPETLRGKIREAAREGAKNVRFILCQSAGYMEYPEPTPEYIENLLFYLEYGYACLTGGEADHE